VSSAVLGLKHGLVLLEFAFDENGDLGGPLLITSLIATWQGGEPADGSSSKQQPDKISNWRRQSGLIKSGGPFAGVLQP
jgi:hypothetical protein